MGVMNESIRQRARLAFSSCAACFRAAASEASDWSALKLSQPTAPSTINSAAENISQICQGRFTRIQGLGLGPSPAHPSFLLRRRYPGKHIALSAHGEHNPRFVGVVAQFFAQSRNVHVDRARGNAARIDLPDAAQQLVA